MIKESLSLKQDSFGHLASKSTPKNRFKGDETGHKEVKESIANTEARHDDGLGSNTGTEGG